MAAPPTHIMIPPHPPLRYFAMAATGYLGALTMVLGLSRFIKGESHFNVIRILDNPVEVRCGEWQCYVVSLGWVVFGTLGLVAQVGCWDTSIKAHRMPLSMLLWPACIS